jgi:hypothetical protein
MRKCTRIFPLFSYLPFHVITFHTTWRNAQQSSLFKKKKFITFHIHGPIAHKDALVIVEFQSHESKKLRDNIVLTRLIVVVVNLGTRKAH